MQDKLRQTLLKKLPKMDLILNSFKNHNQAILKSIATKKLSNLRDKILNLNSNDLKKLESSDFLKEIKDEIKSSYDISILPSLEPLINATGVVLQTNLGRSLIHSNIIKEISPILSHYSNLEYDLDKGERGERYTHISNMLCSLFNVESALLVNNNAAAVFLILNTFAKNKEVIISRGELVEIGGSFRIPEIMESSNAILKEVGSTNKTHLRDYINAICEDSTMIMKAHKSNYEIIGFSKEVEMSEISRLCKERNLIDYYDLGSGYVRGIECSEPSLESIAKNPPSLLSFSGDKLFGSTQAGIILGKAELIERLKQNHLLRAFRVDKISIAILQATLKRYIQNNIDEILTLKMLSYSKDELDLRAKSLAKIIPSFFNPTIISLDSLSGGGSLPNMKFASKGVSLFIKDIKANKLESLLRKHRIISRILDNKVVFDVRSIQDDEFIKIKEIMQEIKKEILKKD